MKDCSNCKHKPEPGKIYSVKNIHNFKLPCDICSNRYVSRWKKKNQSFSAEVYAEIIWSKDTEYKTKEIVKLVKHKIQESLNEARNATVTVHKGMPPIINYYTEAFDWILED